MEDGIYSIWSISYSFFVGYFIIDNFLGDTKSILFGVFDGHGGRDIVDYLIKTLPEVFKKEYLKN